LKLFTDLLQAAAKDSKTRPMKENSMSTYYIQKLKEDFSLKQRANPHYSLRSYSKHLGLHSSTLSQILSGKRGLPLKKLKDVANKLTLTPKDQTLFFESVLKVKTRIDEIKIDPLDDRFILDESYFKIISEWEHYAALSLMDLDNFKMSPETISQRLDIPKNRAEVVIHNLLTSGLIVKDGTKNYKKTHENIRTTEDVKSNALQKAHKEILNMSIHKLDDIDLELRDFSAIRMALDMEKLPELKTIIREFRQKVSALTKTGHKTEVYQLSIQLVPLTKLEKTKKEIRP